MTVDCLATEIQASGQEAASVEELGFRLEARAAEWCQLLPFFWAGLPQSVVLRRADLGVCRLLRRDSTS